MHAPASSSGVIATSRRAVASRLGIPRSNLQIEQPGHSVCGQRAEPVALAQLPFLEARLADLDALEKLTSIEAACLLQCRRCRLMRTALSKASTSTSSPSLSQADAIGSGRSSVQPRPSSDRSVVKRLAQAVARRLLVALAPEQAGEPAARHRHAPAHRKKSEQTLQLGTDTA